MNIHNSTSHVGEGRFDALGNNVEYQFVAGLSAFVIMPCSLLIVVSKTTQSTLKPKLRILIESISSRCCTHNRRTTHHLYYYKSNLLSRVSKSICKFMEFLI